MCALLWLRKIIMVMTIVTFKRVTDNFFKNEHKITANLVR